MSGLVYNGSTAGNIMINGVVPNVYYNGVKIWPNSTPVVSTQYKCRVEGTGLITCKYLKCNNAFPNEPYTYKDAWSDNSIYANYMIKGEGGGNWVYNYPNSWFECTFYFAGTLTSFKYTTMDSKPASEWLPDNMSETKITLTNLSTNTVVLTRTLTPSFATTYTYTL